jgi:hypothetical protein
MPNSADTCSKCGGNVAAPRAFYLGWVFGGGVIFLICYMIGTFAGGVIVESMSAATDEQILTEINATRKAGDPAVKSLLEVKPEQVIAVRAVVTSRAKAAMSPAVRGILAWVFPAFLFVLAGIIVGFMSDGKTIIEAGIGAVIGMVGGFLLHVYVFDTKYTWLVVAIGLIPGAALAVLGAWLGEVFQLRKEAAS